MSDDEMAEMSDEEMSDDEMADMDMSEGGGHHAMAHPFYVHMGLPDGPGEANIRVYGIGRLGTDGKVGPDGGFHIEAGLVPRLGIHIRNDAIWRTGMVEPSEPQPANTGTAPTRAAPDSGSEEGGETSQTEVMAMLSILQNDSGTRGLSLFGQIGFPTIRNGGEMAVTGAFGPSGRIMVKDRFVFDANFHLAASAKKFMGEYEAGAMVRVVKQLFIMVENRGEVAVGSFESSILPGIKYRFGSISVGLGAQVPVTPDPLYRAQGMLQVDIGFM